MKIKAILSTTVLPLDGTYQVKTLNAVPDIRGVTHFIGHPATREIIENLGAVSTLQKMFKGLEVGESALACSIKQDRTNRKDNGFTSPHQDVTISDLQFRLITRIE
jgi:hypothetical protein